MYDFNQYVAGCCYLSIWRKSETSDLELAFTSNIEGIYYSFEGCSGQPTHPKVLFSPAGKFVVSLDIGGSLYLYKLDNHINLFSASPNGGVSAFEGAIVSSNVTDFTWWSDRVVTVAERNGKILMLDILDSNRVVCDAGVYSSPVIERAQSLKGYIFILQSTGSVCKKEIDILPHSDDTGSYKMATEMCLSLVSLSEKSITEMYSLLISKHDYQGAFVLADQHGLDRDDILKAQWSDSEFKVSDVTMYLFKVKDQAFVLSECLDKVGATEDAERALLTRGIQLTEQYGFSEPCDEEDDHPWDFRIKRIQLLQFKDKLETYLGINMGRWFYSQNFS